MAPRGPLPPRVIPGVLRLKQGRDADGNLDIFAAADCSADRNFLLTAFCQKRFRPALSGTDELEPSIIAELEARGYDLATLQFSIRKKAPADPASR